MCGIHLLYLLYNVHEFDELTNWHEVRIFRQQQVENQLRLRENEVDALQVELEQLRNANTKYEAQKREYNKVREELRIGHAVKETWWC